MISIYISDDKIKLVEGVMKSKKIFIKKMIEMESKSGSVETGTIKDVLGLTQDIQSLMNDCLVKPQKAVVVIDNSRIVFRETIVPALPPKKLRIILATEFFADGKQKNNCIDYIVENQFLDDEKKKKYKVHITYQSTEAILNIGKACKELAVKVQAVDIAQNATRKLIENSFADIVGTNILIDYKDSFLSIYVFENGTRKYSKSSQMNSRPATDTFGDNEYFVSELNNNITSVTRYYESKNEGTVINGIYITGSTGVFIEEIMQALSNKCKLPVSFLPCPANIVGIDTNDFNKYSCAIGAMIRRSK